ncbi:MAG TPA: hypothetical protein DDW52_09460 [Planctomycetaceae bacterium]|nr:hypothetical protein [Planctomycetaceae bacterium]
MNNRRILFVVGCLGGGGYQRQLLILAKRLVASGVSVHVAVWRPSGNEVYSDLLRDVGVRLHVVKDGFFLSKLWDLLRIAAKSKAGIIHSYAFTSNFPVWLVAFALRKSSVGSIRGMYEWERRGAGRLRGVLSSVFPKQLVANSIASAEEARACSAFGAPRRVRYIGNAVELGPFSLPKEPQPGGVLRVVGIGRLDENKNWGRAIQLVEEIQRIRGPRLSLAIWGEGPLRLQLQGLVKESADVTFPGFTTDPRCILREAHMVVLCSDNEGTPNVVLEALAEGRPVVATAVGDVPRIVRHGVEGLVYSTESYVASAAADIAELVSIPGRLSKMARNARARAEQDFSPSKLESSTIDLYRELRGR